MEATGKVAQVKEVEASLLILWFRCMDANESAISRIVSQELKIKTIIQLFYVLLHLTFDIFE